MTIRRIHLLCAPVLITLSADLLAVARADELRLDFDVKTVVTPTAAPEGAAIIRNQEKESTNERSTDVSKPRTTQAKLHVGLGRRYFYVDDGENRTFYDFERRRILTVHRATKTYEDESLYPVIGFRRAELQNQIMLGDVLGSAGLNAKQNPFQSSFELETRFSIRSPKGQKPDLDVQENGDTKRFVVAGRVAVECEFSGPRIPDDLRGSFSKFLIYDCSLHPEIRQKILEPSRIPSRLTYHHSDAIASTETTLRLQGSKSSADIDSATPPEGFTLQVDLESELDKIIHQVRTHTTDSPASTKEQVVAQARKDFDNQNYLGAFLTLIGFNLQTGVLLPDEMKKLQPFFPTDARLQQYFAANGMVNPQNADNAIERFEKIDRTDLESGYVIDIMIAVAKMLKQDFSEAKEQYLKALRKNPHVAGVYHDLGAIYNNEYEMPMGWKCWDTARLIAPNHSMLEPVNRYEQQLAKDFPEYFD